MNDALAVNITGSDTRFLSRQGAVTARSAACVTAAAACPCRYLAGTSTVVVSRPSCMAANGSGSPARTRWYVERERGWLEAQRHLVPVSERPALEPRQATPAFPGPLYSKP